MKNRQDILDVIEKFGGPVALIKAAPALLRIIKTVKADSADDIVDDIGRRVHYSEQTKARVRLFQEKFGLTADGLVGDETWNKVEEIVAKAGL